MKKTKLLKCLLPLLGVSALTIVPILSTACANGVINNQTQSVNETLVDEVSSSTSGANTQTESTSTSVIDEYYKNKKSENEQILKNIKWFYKNPITSPENLDDKNQIKLDLSPSNLDEAITEVYDLNSGHHIITDMQNGSATLGFYPYVKLGKNQYTPFNPVKTTTNSGTTTTTIKNQWFLKNENLMLKDKILTMDYFIPEVKLAISPAQSQKEKSNNLVDSYKLSIHKLTLSDATSEFPNGDPRTITSLVYNTATSSKNSNSSASTIIDITRPSPKSIKDLLAKYQEVVKNSTEDVEKVTTFLQQINELQNKENQKPFELQKLSEDFKKFHEINQSNVDALNKNLEQEDAPIFTIIEKVTRALFTNGTNKLFTTIEGIVTKLKNIKSSNNPSGDESGKNQIIHDTADTVGVILYATIYYYFSFANDLLDLAEKCVSHINWDDSASSNYVKQK